VQDGVNEITDRCHKSGNGTRSDHHQKNPGADRFFARIEESFLLCASLRRELGSQITLLHVLEPETPLTLAERPVAAAFSEEELADVEEGLRDLTNLADASGIAGTRSIIRCGVATHEIVEAAKHLDIDLIVNATHGFTGCKHFATGSTATATPAPGGGRGLVWVNTETHIYHKEGSRFYGTTKKGKYVSEADAIKEGDRAAARGQ
jgi:hypothetical protein